jgi:hypothetical protein
MRRWAQRWFKGRIVHGGRVVGHVVVIGIADGSGIRGGLGYWITCGQRVEGGGIAVGTAKGT